MREVRQSLYPSVWTMRKLMQRRGECDTLLLCEFCRRAPNGKSQIGSLRRHGASKIALVSNFLRMIENERGPAFYHG
jgi:hypothetical protein